MINHKHVLFTVFILLVASATSYGYIDYVWESVRNAMYDDDRCGYESPHLYWEAGGMTYLIDIDGTPDDAGEHAAISSAGATWNDVDYCTFTFTNGGSLNFDTVDFGVNDGQNIMIWFESDWPYDPSVIAVNYHYYTISNGRLLDADIAFNGEDYNWTVGDILYKWVDVETVALHEMGHSLTLGDIYNSPHSGWALCMGGGNGEQTMYGVLDVSGYTVIDTTLATGDMRGIRYIYPEPIPSLQTWGIIVLALLLGGILLLKTHRPSCRID